MNTPKNTMMRDKNGKIREGVKWYLEFNDVLTRFFGNECGYSRGFQKVVIDGHGYLASVFELDIEKKPSQQFLDFIKDYKSSYLKGIVYQKEIKVQDHVLYRNAVIALL